MSPALLRGSRLTGIRDRLFKVRHFRKLIFLGMLDLDGEGITVLRNVGRYLPKDRASSYHVTGVLDEVMFVLIVWQSSWWHLRGLSDSPPLWHLFFHSFMSVRTSFQDVHATARAIYITTLMQFVANRHQVSFLTLRCATWNSFQSLLYCPNSCTSLHFKTLKSHIKTLKFAPTCFGLL